ncbi:MAG: hypothetical protein HY789_15735 [Deltaproteobacteria bacterium]|nr:hypothetical protein [Deltaproteobacteria bacterium]
MKRTKMRNEPLGIGIVVGSFCIAINLSFPPVATAAYTWVKYNSHWYTLTEKWESWIDAESEAVSAGGHLVTINDSKENSWLAENYRYTYVEGHTGDGLYAAANIGYYYDPEDTAWEWISGQPVTYTNLLSTWDYYTGNYAYIHTNEHTFVPGGTWNHAYWHTDPNASLGYLKGIIERDTNPVPLPGAVFLFGAGLSYLFGCGSKRLKGTS